MPDSRRKSSGGKSSGDTIPNPKVPGTPYLTLKAVPGEAIYDKSGRNLVHVTDRQQFEAEIDDGFTSAVART